MDWNLGSLRPQAKLVTCSLCLRVQCGSAWVEAEHVIRELRSYELSTAPHLRPGMCDACADSIFGRRARAAETLAA